MVNYRIIIADNPSDLERSVVRYLKQGWVTTGGPQVTPNKNWSQAVVYYDKT